MRIDSPQIFGGALPNWTSAGTIQAVGIGATTTAPTLPTTTLRNNISYRQLGEKAWEVAGTLRYASATGNALGSGDYLFTLPNSLQFDLTAPNQIAFTGSVNTNSGIIYGYQLASSQMLFSRTADNYASLNQSGVIIWDATRYRLSINNATFTYQCLGSGYIGFDGPAQMNWNFRFTST